MYSLWEFFYEDILQVSNLDYIFNEFLSKMAKKLEIWFQAQHVKNCHTKGIESTVSKLFPNNKDIHVYSWQKDQQCPSFPSSL